MKMSKFKIGFSISGIVLGTLIFITSSIQASFFVPDIKTKRSTLLNGRLSIQAPSTSWRDELAIDLLSEKNLFKDQTVLDYNKNGNSLRIIATELFARRTDNLQGNLAKLIYNYPQKVGLQYKITQIDRNRFELVPSKLLLVKGTALVRSLFFVNSDDTIQSIDIYMNRNAVSSPKKSIILAKKLLRSIRPGKKKLRKGPRVVHLGSKKKPHYFKIRLPKGYVISSKKKNRARVHIVRKLVPLGHSQTSLAIYIGQEPSPFQSKFGEYDTSKDAAHGKLLGTFIHWRTLKKAQSIKRQLVKASAILPWSEKNISNQQFYIHVFADSDSKKGMNKMVRLAGKLQYVKKPRYSITALQPQHNDRGVPGYPTPPNNPQTDAPSIQEQSQYTRNNKPEYTQRSNTRPRADQTRRSPKNRYQPQHPKHNSAPKSYTENDPRYSRDNRDRYYNDYETYNDHNEDYRDGHGGSRDNYQYDQPQHSHGDNF